jgi:hypothetical protein
VPLWCDVTGLPHDVIKHSVLRDVARSSECDADKSWIETDEPDLEHSSVEEIPTPIQVTQNSNTFGSGVGSESTTGITFDPRKKLVWKAGLAEA